MTRERLKSEANQKQPTTAQVAARPRGPSPQEKVIALQRAAGNTASTVLLKERGAEHSVIIVGFKEEYQTLIFSPPVSLEEARKFVWRSPEKGTDISPDKEEAPVAGKQSRYKINVFAVLAWWLPQALTERFRRVASKGLAQTAMRHEMENRLPSEIAETLPNLPKLDVPIPTVAIGSCPIIPSVEDEMLAGKFHRFPGEWEIRGKRFPGTWLVRVRNGFVEAWQLKPELNAYMEMTAGDADRAMRLYEADMTLQNYVLSYWAQGYPIDDSLGMMRMLAELDLKQSIADAYKAIPIVTVASFKQGAGLVSTPSKGMRKIAGKPLSQPPARESRGETGGGRGAGRHPSITPASHTGTSSRGGGGGTAMQKTTRMTPEGRAVVEQRPVAVPSKVAPAPRPAAAITPSKGTAPAGAVAESKYQGQALPLSKPRRIDIRPLASGKFGAEAAAQRAPAGAVALSKSHGYAPAPLREPRGGGSVPFSKRSTVTGKVGPYVFPGKASGRGHHKAPGHKSWEKVQAPAPLSQERAEKMPSPSSQAEKMELPAGHPSGEVYELGSQFPKPGLFRIDRMPKAEQLKAWAEAEKRQIEERRHVLLVDVNGKTVLLAVSGSGKAEGHTEFAVIEYLLEHDMLHEGDWLLMQGIIGPCSGHSEDCGMCRDVLNLICRELMVEVIYVVDALRLDLREAELDRMIDNQAPGVPKTKEAQRKWKSQKLREEIDKAGSATTYCEPGEGIWRRTAEDYRPLPKGTNPSLEKIKKLIAKVKQGK